MQRLNHTVDLKFMQARVELFSCRQRRKLDRFGIDKLQCIACPRFIKVTGIAVDGINHPGVALAAVAPRDLIGGEPSR